MSMLDQKNQLIDTLYWTTRTDIIRQEDITRQDKLLEESITRAEEARKQAIKDWDVAAAKDQSYKLAYLEKQNELNKKAFQWFSTSWWLMVFNPNTWEVEFKPADWTEWVTPTSFIQTWTWTVTQNYGATSPVTRDNVKLADWTTWTPWIDIDGQIWDIISSFSDWKVIALQEANESGWFGRRIVIEDTDWNQHVYNHLNASAVHVWDEVKRGQTIAEMWNTW
jgi:murein DD-endopeptidase MepM/ murein hydrolase activator NlpD